MSVNRVTVTIKGEAVQLDQGEALALLHALRVQLLPPPPQKLSEFNYLDQRWPLGQVDTEV
jgi:hypothetical protein